MEEPRRRRGDAGDGDGGGPACPLGCKRWTRSSSGSLLSMRRDEQQRIEELEWRVEVEVRSLGGGGGRGMKLLSNPSQCFLAAFIGPGLLPSPSQKRFRAKAFTASGKSSSREQARAPPHAPKLACASASRRRSFLNAFWPPTTRSKVRPCRFALKRVLSNA
jgi:hypothetical protein